MANAENQPAGDGRAFGRRQFCGYLGLSAMALLGTTCVDPRQVDTLASLLESVPVQQRPETFSTTFSQLYCEQTKLNTQQAYQNVLDFGFDRVRICFYPQELDDFENSPIKKIFTMTEEHNLRRRNEGKPEMKATAAIGTFIPRNPEIYFRGELAQAYGPNAQLLRGVRAEPLDYEDFIAQGMLDAATKSARIVALYPFIDRVQVENEPLSGLDSAYKLRMSPEFHRKEVAEVREIIRPDQEIALNFPTFLTPIYSTADEELIYSCMDYVDTLGLDVYMRIPTKLGTFNELSAPFWRKLRRVKSTIENNGKKAIIAEAQAEPWEFGHDFISDKVMEYKSIGPEDPPWLIRRLASEGFSEVSAWGFEFWHRLALAGNTIWRDKMQEIALARA